MARQGKSSISAELRQQRKRLEFLYFSRHPLRMVSELGVTYNWQDKICAIYQEKYNMHTDHHFRVNLLPISDSLFLLHSFRLKKQNYVIRIRNKLIIRAIRSEIINYPKHKSYNIWKIFQHSTIQHFI